MACGVNPTNLIYATSVLKVELAAFMRKKNKPSSEGVDELIAALRRLEERQAAQLREATEFKPGELTPEEEKWVQEHGLNALNYIPQSTLQRHAEGWRNYHALLGGSVSGTFPILICYHQLGSGIFGTRPCRL